MIFASKIVIAAFAVLYTIIAYSSMLLREGRIKKVYVYLMFPLTLIIHEIAFGIMWYITDDVFYAFYGLGTGAGLFVYHTLFSLLYRNHNVIVKNHMCMMISTGIIMLARLNQNKCIRQLGAIAIALTISLLIPVIIRKCGFIRNLSMLFAIAGIAVLLFVCVRGNTVNGARISLTLAGFTFQPTEFIKIVFVLFLAAFFAKRVTRIRVLIAAGFCAAYIGILIFCKDLGSAAIFAVTFLFLVYEASGKRRYFLCGVGIFVVGLVGAYFMFSHVRVRFDMWIDPWKDVEGKGYQIVQSLFSIANGNWFGTGLFGGKPNLIPFVDADMIFSAMVEELGVVYGLCLILNCLHCYYSAMKMADRLDRGFYRYVSYGLGNAFIFQILLTIGGGTKYIPLTGVTLPWISYGGSSIMATGIVFGILQGLCLVANDEDLAREARRREEEYRQYMMFAMGGGFQYPVGNQVNKDIDNVVMPVADNEYHSIDEYDHNIDSGVDLRDDSDTDSLTAKKQSHAFRNSILFFFACFAGLIIYLIWFTSFKRISVLRNEYNVMRTVKRSEEFVRGSIYSTDGVRLAYTDPGDPDKRIYPYGEYFAHVLGYVDGQGAGIEAKENYMLSVSNVNVFKELKMRMNHEPIFGANIYTTLDYDLQMAAYEALGEYDGACIVMNPKTGEILAMVSKPTFDPNHMDEVFRQISQNPKEAVLLNRATQGQYPPGSTFKILTLMEYLREHPKAAEAYDYNCIGSLFYGEYSIRCYNGKAHGNESLLDCFAYSCNCAFGDIGLQLDRDKYGKLLSDMLFNKSLPYDFAYEKSSATVNENTSDARLVQISIGQGTTTMSPLHLAMITSAIANHGVLNRPYLVDVYEQADGILRNAGYGNQSYELMSPNEADELLQYMQAVTEYGTADRVNPEYRIVGKTGTAEHSDGKAVAHAWFTGFAPYDNPEIVVTIICENAGAASRTAVPAAEKIFKAYYDKRK